LYLRQHHGAREAKAKFDGNPTPPAKEALDKAVGELNDWVDSMGARDGRGKVERVMESGKIDPTKKTLSDVRIWGWVVRR